MPLDAFIQDPAYSTRFESYRAILHRLLDHDPLRYELPKDLLVVDVGCGFGDLLKRLREGGHQRLMGVEPDALCREGARKAGFDVREGTLTATGLADASVDAVMVSQVFHHVSDHEGAVQEVSRILKPGGFLCLMEPLNTPLRWGMDVLTFRVPLRRILPSVSTRYDIIRFEVETGLYPRFLREQPLFHALLDRHFSKVWHRWGFFFQFGKYVKRAQALPAPSRSPSRGDFSLAWRRWAVAAQCGRLLTHDGLYETPSPAGRDGAGPGG